MKNIDVPEDTTCFTLDDNDELYYSFGNGEIHGINGYKFIGIGKIINSLHFYGNNLFAVSELNSYFIQRKPYKETFIEDLRIIHRRACILRDKNNIVILDNYERKFYVVDENFWKQSYYKDILEQINTTRWLHRHITQDGSCFLSADMLLVKIQYENENIEMIETDLQRLMNQFDYRIIDYSNEFLFVVDDRYHCLVKHKIGESLIKHQKMKLEKTGFGMRVSKNCDIGVTWKLNKLDFFNPETMVKTYSFFLEEYQFVHDVRFSSDSMTLYVLFNEGNQQKIVVIDVD